MGVVEYLAALAEIPKEYGCVSALDGRTGEVFVGTDQGYVLHLKVEDEVGPDQEQGERENWVGLPQEQQSSAIYTSSVGGMQVLPGEREAVVALQCCRNQPLLFALCGTRLTIINFSSWQVQGALEVAVSRFCIVDGISELEWNRLQQRDTEGTQTLPKAKCTSEKEDFVVLTISESGSSEVEVIYVDVGPTAPSPLLPGGVAHRTRLAVPSTVESLAAVGRGAVAICWRRGLKLLLLEKMQLVRLMLPMPLRHPRTPPLVAVSRDGELSVCLGDTIFSCPLGDLFVSPAWEAEMKKHYYYDEAQHTPMSIPASEWNSEMGSPSSLLEGTTSPDSTSSPREPEIKVQWSRTRCAHQEVVCIATHYPHLLQFSTASCLVTLLPPPISSTESSFSIKTTASVIDLTDSRSSFTEKVNIPNILFVVAPWAGLPRVYAASATSVWMLAIKPLKEQWATLVDQGCPREGLQWCYRERCRKMICSQTFEGLSEMEEEFRRLAGFYLLYRGKIEESFFFLRETSIDVRDLLVLVAECVPEKALAAWFKVYGSNIISDRRRKKSTVKSSSIALDSAVTGAANYWEAWKGPPLRDYERFHPARLVEGWEEESRCLQRHAQSAGTHKSEDDSSFQDSFTRTCWGELKKGLEYWLRQKWIYLSPSESRAAAYALLVLSLERRDWAAAYSLCLSPRLELRDVKDLLLSLQEYRLLSCVLWMSGMQDEALQLAQTRLYISSILSFHRGGDDKNSVGLTDAARFTTSVVFTSPLNPSETKMCNVGRGWCLLPQSMRERCAFHLLHVNLPSEALGEHSKTSGEPDSWKTCMPETAWVLAVSHLYEAKMCESLERYREKMLLWRGEKTTSSVSFRENEKWSNLAPSMALKHPPIDLPLVLGLEFVLVDHSDLINLQEKLRIDPLKSQIVDEEGSSLLHAAMGPLASLQKLSKLSSELCDVKREMSRIRRSVLHAVSVLIESGCPTEAINMQGVSCLDLAAVLDPEFSDEWTAALLSSKSISGSIC